MTRPISPSDPGAIWQFRLRNAGDLRAGAVKRIKFAPPMSHFEK